MTTETLTCAVCSEPVGMLRITRTVLRLGHLREPHPIHPVQLARSATASLVGASGDGSLNERLATRREDGANVGLSTASPRRRPARTINAGKPERIQRRLDRLLSGEGDPAVCWEFQGRRYRGYGRMDVQGKTKPAHRVAYELLVGPIPEGLTLDHLCRNRACCNPAHLEPVTNRENVLRGAGLTAEFARRTHCKRGHELPAVGPKGYRDCRACYGLRPADLARDRARRLSTDPAPASSGRPRARGVRAGSQRSGQGVLASVHPPGSAPRPALNAGSRST